MNQRVLVTGARGMLGTDIVRVFSKKFECFPFGREDLDITDPRSCLLALKNVRPDILVNCAAFTKVDLCETNPEVAFCVNARGARNLAEACMETSTLLVHISTDYVFDGESRRPYREGDATGPINTYGASKLEGEKAIEAYGSNFLIVRTAWLYGEAGPNFVKTVLDLSSRQEVLRVVDDQVGSPTYTRDLAEGILDLSMQRACGIVHLTNQGSCSWFELARQTLRYSGIDPDKVVPISSSEFSRPARRPRYSVLDNGLFWSITGRRLRHWRDALRGFLNSHTYLS